MMTNERLAEIEARAEKATAGPWIVGFRDGSGRGENHEGFFITNKRDEVIVVGGKDSWGARYGVLSWPSAKFIAHARADIPDLLAEIKRLRDLAGEGGR